MSRLSLRAAAAAVLCTLGAATPAFAADTQLPTAPGQPGIIDRPSNKRVIAWAPATDDVGVVRYDISVSGPGTGTSTSGSVTTAALSINPDANVSITIRAVDAAGNVSASSSGINDFRYFIEPVGNVDRVPPTTPGTPAIEGYSAEGMVVGWAESTDNYLRIDGYDLFDGTVKVASTIGNATSTTIRGRFTAAGPASLTVVAHDHYGNTSAPSPALVLPTPTPTATPTPTETPTPTPTVTPTPTPRPTVTPTVPPTPTPTLTPAPTQLYGFGIGGTASLRTLVKGSVAVRGAGNLVVTTDTGVVTAQLGLDLATTKLTALGVLPVVAQLAFAPTANASFGPVAANGALSPDGAITLTAKARVKVLRASVFGVQLVQGGNCQTTQPSTISLAGAGFSPATGGTLTGTFNIGNLSGCGALTGLVSPLVAGGGNALVLALAPGPVVGFPT